MYENNGSRKMAPEKMAPGRNDTMHIWKQMAAETRCYCLLTFNYW